MKLKRPRQLLAVLLILYGWAGSVLADGFDLGAPRLHPALPPDMLAAPQQAVTTGGVDCGPGKDLCVSPLLGVDHQKRETVDPVHSLTHHDFNFRAGWRLSLFDALQLSTLAKLPLVTAEQSEGMMTGDYRSGATTRIRASDQPLAVGSTMNWGSDVQLKINNRFNLNLFYDYSRSSGPSGQQSPDERFGTRLEYKFK